MPPEDRRARVEGAFESIASGERFYVVSDRDPTPLREYLLEIVDGDAEETIESFEVKRQNPETWLARTTAP